MPWAVFRAVLPIPIPVANPSNLFPSRQPTAFLTGLMAQPLTQQYRIGLNISLHGVMRDIAQEATPGQAPDRG